MEYFVIRTSPLNMPNEVKKYTDEGYLPLGGIAVLDKENAYQAVIRWPQDAP
jgi:hypothetical protein